MDPTEKNRLVYVQKTTMKLGTGSTSRNAESETFYEAFPLEDGTYKMVLMDMNDQSTGLTEIVDPEELKKSYEPSPNYFENKMTELDRKVAKKIANGREHLKKEEFFSAEFEFEGVIEMDDRNLEAHVSKSEAQIGQGDLDAAKSTLEKVSEFEELYEKSNKHVFNQFGMTLRKGGFFEKAVESYAKALRIDPGDENLFYNIGRATFEKGEQKKAVIFLKKCLDLNPGHKEAAALVDKIRRDAEAGSGG